VIAITAGLLSAFLWARSAMAVVRSDRPDNHYRDATTIVGGIDFFATVKISSTWNRWAAITAAVAAVAQAGSTLIH
jgi:hypothetical protein